LLIRNKPLLRRKREEGRSSLTFFLLQSRKKFVKELFEFLNFLIE